jgi:PAS domain S-box-containing protein
MDDFELGLDEYKRFFDNAPIALLRTDIKSSKVLMGNQYCVELLGFGNVSELLKSKLNEMYPKDERQKLIGRIKKQGSVQGYEICLTRKDGKRIWVAASLHINCGGSCIEGSLIDITVQKEAQAELEQFRNAQLHKLSTITEKLDQVINEYD